MVEEASRQSRIAQLRAEIATRQRELDTLLGQGQGGVPAATSFWPAATPPSLPAATPQLSSLSASVTPTSASPQLDSSFSSPDTAIRKRALSADACTETSAQGAPQQRVALDARDAAINAAKLLELVMRDSEWRKHIPSASFQAILPAAAAILDVAVTRLLATSHDSLIIPPATPASAFIKWVDERVPGLSDVLLTLLCGADTASESEFSLKRQLAVERLPTLLSLVMYTRSHRRSRLQHHLGAAMVMHGLSASGLDILHSLGVVLHPRAHRRIATAHTPQLDRVVAADARPKCPIFTFIFDDLIFVRSQFLLRTAQGRHSAATNMVTSVVQVLPCRSLSPGESLACPVHRVLYVPSPEQSSDFGFKLVDNVAAPPMVLLKAQLDEIQKGVEQSGVYSPPAAHKYATSSISAYRGYIHTDSRPCMWWVTNISLGAFKSVKSFIVAVVDFVKNCPHLCEDIIQSPAPFFSSADSWGLRIWIATLLWLDGQRADSRPPEATGLADTAAGRTLWSRVYQFLSRTIPLSGSLHSELSLCKLVAKTWPVFVDQLLTDVLRRNTSLLTSKKTHWYSLHQQLQDGFALALLAWRELRDDVISFWAENRLLQSPPVASSYLLFEFALPLAVSMFRIAAKEGGQCFLELYRLFELTEITLCAAHYGKVPLVYLYAFEQFSAQLQQVFMDCSPHVNERRVELAHSILKRLVNAQRLDVESSDEAVLREFLRAAAFSNGDNDVVALRSQRVYSSLGTARNSTLLPVAIGQVGSYIEAISRAATDPCIMVEDQGPSRQGRAKGAVSASHVGLGLAELPPVGEVLALDPEKDDACWKEMLTALDKSAYPGLSLQVATLQLHFQYGKSNKSGTRAKQLLTGLTLKEVHERLHAHGDKYFEMPVAVPDSEAALNKLRNPELYYLCFKMGKSLSGAGTRQELFERLGFHGETAAYRNASGDPGRHARALGDDRKARRQAELEASELDRLGHFKRTFHQQPAAAGQKALSPISAKVLPVSYRLLDEAALQRRLRPCTDTDRVQCDACGGVTKFNDLQLEKLCFCMVCRNCYGQELLCGGKCRSFLARRVAAEQQSLTVEIQGMAARPHEKTVHTKCAEDKAMERSMEETDDDDGDGDDNDVGCEGEPAAGRPAADSSPSVRSEAAVAVRKLCDDIQKEKRSALDKLRAVMTP